MFTLTHKTEGIFLMIIAGIIGLFLTVSVNKARIPAMIAINANSISDAHPIEISVSKESTFSEISSDGNKRVVLKTARNGDKTQEFTLYTQDAGDDKQRLIFNITLGADERIIIPYNAWSPDNKYFFIQENTSLGNKILVFNAKGESFPTGEIYLDLTELFKKKETVNSFSEATGWGSETLIIVNTRAQDNSKGPSYWFEVPGKAIIQLSTEF